MKTLNRVLCRFVTSALFLIVAAACSVETQKAQENFADGKLPPTLAKLANQTIELRRHVKKIKARMAADASRFTLPVAVIDNGVDLAHPDLVDRFEYRVENGEITGAGRDFMGDDDFASAVLINPELYAFSAAEIKDGLIVMQDKNPFKLMLEFDEEVRQLFLSKVQGDATLAKSIFRTFSDRSINVFNLYRVLNGEAKKVHFDPETYAANKKEGKLLTVNFRADAANNDLLAKAWDLATVHYLLDRTYWDLSLGDTVFNLLNRIEHGDLLFQKLKETFQEYPRFAELKAAIDRVAEFKAQRDHSATVDMAAKVNDACVFLSEALEYQKQGITPNDPILNLRSHSVFNELYNIDMIRHPQVFPVIEEASSLPQRALRDSVRKLNMYREIIDQTNLTAQEKFAFRGFEKAYHANLNMVQMMIDRRGVDLERIFDPDYHSDYTSLYRRYHYRNRHPYLSDLSADESHGTHVSGIIAAQNEALRIYPVRVTTRSALVTKKERARLIASLKSEFEAWLAEPVVARAVYQKMRLLAPAEMTAEPATAEERAVLAKHLMATAMNDAIDMAFESNALDFIFVDELKKAIRHVAEQKIKVANISLGTENSLKIPRFAEIDIAKDLPKVFAFLHFEFIKYQLGQILATDAKDTLFVVAAGNSSTWIDGKTHGALPVDLTSPFLAKFEDDQDYVAPNNHLKNILGVGSLSPDEDLSDFTNVLLGVRTPLIFAVGENILSPVKTTDSMPVYSVLRKRMPDVFATMPVPTADERFMAKALERPEFAHLKGKDDAATKVGNYFMSGFLFFQTALNAQYTDLAMLYSDHRTPLSGTSMATPAIVGYIGDMIVRFATSANLSRGDIYAHPEMTPPKLIQALMAQAQPVFADQPNSPFRKIDVRGKYERGAKTQELDKLLDEVLK